MTPVRVQSPSTFLNYLPSEHPDDRLSFQEFMYGFAQWLGLLEDEDDFSSVWSSSLSQSQRPLLAVDDINPTATAAADESKTGGFSPLDPYSASETWSSSSCDPCPFCWHIFRLNLLHALIRSLPRAGGNAPRVGAVSTRANCNYYNPYHVRGDKTLVWAK